MSILLPPKPAIRTAAPRLLDFGAVLTPPGGGPSQRLNRLGNRFAVDVVAATSRSGAEGRILVARLMRALTEGVLLPFWQGLDVGTPGTPQVNGGGQQGSTLQLKGFTSGYAVREGQFFSIIYGGRRYLHAAAADVTASDTGTMALPIVPMLRISPNDGATCEFVQPMIEGFLAGNQVQWQLQLAPYTDVSFTVTEAE